MYVCMFSIHSGTAGRLQTKSGVGPPFVPGQVLGYPEWAWKTFVLGGIASEKLAWTTLVLGGSASEKLAWATLVLGGSASKKSAWTTLVLEGSAFLQKVLVHFQYLFSP